MWSKTGRDGNRSRQRGAEPETPRRWKKETKDAVGTSENSIANRYRRPGYESGCCLSPRNTHRALEEPRLLGRQDEQNTFSREEVECLDREIQEDEVVEVLRAMKSWEAPGPDRIIPEMLKAAEARCQIRGNYRGISLLPVG
ncbi:MAG: uncharacterized protein A8A55_1835 [Amphiamblys sp. WSBS2006]|nr:MAG: uncharacterized protein A8A55_1835 [Amphiamblys sp. WSBS2006]